MSIFLHELTDAKALFEAVSRDKGIPPILIEKDYWLMHCLWGIQQQGFKFELKGGTSLSKGFGLIERFSEDIDIRIEPSEEDNVYMNKNHNKPQHIKSRQLFFDSITKQLNIHGLTFSRDHNFDDLPKMRNAGIRAEYQTHFSSIKSIKDGVLLELGFDKTTPSTPCHISSWAWDTAHHSGIKITDNRAQSVNCYCPEYTFVEKLQAISTKYQQQQERASMPINFLRHYYDIYQLLNCKRVIIFIGTQEYHNYKATRFRAKDEINISMNNAFILPDQNIRELYAREFNKKIAIYYGKPPTFFDIIERIKNFMHQL